MARFRFKMMEFEKAPVRPRFSPLVCDSSMRSLIQQGIHESRFDFVFGELNADYYRNTKKAAAN
jgi:hypothetical protein